MGLNHFMKKTMIDIVIRISFLAWPNTFKLFKSGIHFAVRWIIRFLGPISFFQIAYENFKWPIKILIFVCK